MNNTAEYKDVYINDIREDINNSNFPEYKHILNYSKCNARIYQDLTIIGDLNLDESIEGVCVIIIEGNLTVEGNIYNEDGTYLYVKGKTTAKNIITGDPVVSLNEVEIENFMVCWGNNGQLNAKSIKTKIFINYDLHIDCQDLNITLSYDSEYQGKYSDDLEDFEEDVINKHHSEFITYDVENDDQFFDIGEQIKKGNDLKLADIMINSAKNA